MPASDDDHLTLEAAVLVRGDLPDLRPDVFQALDSAIDVAMTHGDAAVSARRIRVIIDDARLSARLRAFEFELATGRVAAFGLVRDLTSAGALPGDPADGVATVWTCPRPPSHFRKRQRIAGQNMGVCTKHQLSLVRET